MVRPVKAIHIIGGGEFGGAENHIISLLSSFSPSEVDAKVICFYDSAFAASLRERGVKVFVIDDYHRFDPRVAFRLGRIIRDEQPDILHTHGVKANFIGRLIGKYMGRKVLTTVHSLLEHDYNQWLMKQVTYWMERLTRGLTDRFICVSGEIKQDLVSSGVSPDRAVVIPNGIDMHRYANPEQITMFREDLGIPADSFVVGAAARLRPVKGIHLLIEAAGHLRSRLENLHVVVIGDGPQRPELELLVEKLGLKGRVHFLGYQTEVERYLPGLDCFANVSLSEGLPLAVLEAMAARVPVLASAVGAVPEIVENGREGILVEKGSVPAISEGIVKLAGDAEWRKSLADSAYQKVIDTYTTEVMSRNYLNTYRDLLGVENH